MGRGEKEMPCKGSFGSIFADSRVTLQKYRRNEVVKMGELWVDHISYSQLTAAQECPYQWFMLKAVGVEPMENAFAQAGSLAHDILAAWATKNTAKEEMILQWIKGFPQAVTAEFPGYLAAKGYKGKLFDSVLRYFEGFDGFPGYEVVGAEKEFTSMIAGERFIGSLT